VETAVEIRKMGSNLLKMSLSPRYYWENYDIPYQSEIKSLRDLAQEKSVAQVFNMDFTYYQIWIYEFSQYTQEPKGEKRDEYQIKFINGLSDEYADKSYKEIYDLACYLLRKYSGTGKVFYLGNWEGDWHLRWDYNRDKPANPRTVEGMTRWLNVRQKAIDDAKRDTPHNNIGMYHYVEVNLSDLAVKGDTCVVNTILPQINPDYVSFSSYTATNPPMTEAAMDSTLTMHLNHIASKMKPKAGIQGKRLFIGEYGWSESVYSQEEIDQRAKWVIKTAMKWGCPFILFWEMYNNELNDDGSNRGFWLIDQKGSKTPLYYTYQKFYIESREWIIDFTRKQNRIPSQDEFLKAAISFEALK
ncbi:hypothetical protein, partial [Bacteroides nordii]|uniref:hypothetical protein n=2 Tax=Bacteroides TaxID=816 RepID=UPI00241CBCCA